MHCAQVRTFEYGRIAVVIALVIVLISPVNCSASVCNKTRPSLCVQDISILIFVKLGKVEIEVEGDDNWRERGYKWKLD